ncbi:PLD nuclease N-terminal domain-containing protein [uncultured Georgenia sp.]|uniref:PLD nuclease N-terminal domain-containing protein n=1 Tax=uncultured Georgenia sp. TaxID=378209 RepID=UPI00262740A8|nr:PLD nuclease N-terminal domain-containing protein [uncultured Georgenia sp.]HLV04834.1 PLD nuclease N-terminal domain-containing protein [Actinomycetaceae bacterium]
MRYLPLVLLLALVIYALVDCVRSDDEDMPVGLPKAIWVILIIVFPAAGAAAWLVVSRVSRKAQHAGGRGGAAYGAPSAGPATRHPSRPIAPDDDPEFLADLSRRLRQPEPPEPEPEAGPAEGEGPTGDEASSPSDEDGPQPRR